MRGGVARWKRGVASQGVRQALDYAFAGICDSHATVGTGATAAAGYADEHVERFIVQNGTIETDALDRDQLKLWIAGADPESSATRGRELPSAAADLILDSTVNSPKTFSLAAMIDPDIAVEYEALMDRVRDRTILSWQSALNARRGAGGQIRMGLSRIEVVELKHERSRALDPHKHRHLWLNMKVLGDDGRWSNLDSRVALRYQTVINAEGDLATRTDPTFLAALAAKGYTVNERGEIAELEHLVRPMAKRSTQIERNRAELVAAWRVENPNREPTHDVLVAIDRMAWAKGRPNKPKDFDEDEWTARIHDELLAADAHVLAPRAALNVAGAAIADLDRDQLAATAVAEADRRATGSGGRYSLYDVRGGVVRAIAASGIVAERESLEELIEDVFERARTQGSIDLLEEPGPDHVKRFMSDHTLQVKTDLARLLDGLSTQGVANDPAELVALSRTVIEGERTLDVDQAEAAAAIAGTSRLVAVTGPAGAGKTTMLLVARHALEGAGRRMIVVAPTKKAAMVAGREIGVEASSLHSLLLDHGWQFGVDDTGRERWEQLQVGQLNPVTGMPYEGPRRFPLAPGDRVVVDEAGMVDLDAARALAIVAHQTGADVAMVGDHMQATPVGHSGAMAMLKQRAGHVVELTEVHRFRDPEYGELTLRLREPADASAAATIARELEDGGHLEVFANDVDAADRIVSEYMRHTGLRRSVAIVTATNEEARALSEAIQSRRVQAGQIRVDKTAWGRDGQAMHVGDVVQTRLNDVDAKVENRALWTIAEIHDDRLVLAGVHQPGDLRTVSSSYSSDHVHLAYASTVHGVQGETTDVSLVGAGVDAAGLYVGMTRGRSDNVAMVVAGSNAAARAELAETMLRGRPEITIDDSRTAAASELARSAHRAPDPTPAAPARWNDRRTRPLGHVRDIDAHTRLLEGRAGQQRELVSQVTDRLDKNRVTLEEVRARLARGLDPVALERVQSQLTEKIAADTEIRTRLVSELTPLTAAAEAAQAEQAARAALSAAEQLAEARAREATQAAQVDRDGYTGPSL